MNYKSIVFLVLIKSLLITIVNCEETLLLKTIAKDVNNNKIRAVRDRRSLQFGDTFRFSAPVLPSPTSSPSTLYPRLHPFDAPQFWPDRHGHRHRGHHHGHRNYDKTFWDAITTTTEESKRYRTNSDDMRTVTEPGDNISSETTMGVYISSAERNTRKHEINNNNRNIDRVSQKRTGIKNDDNTKSKIDIRFQTEPSNYRNIITTTDQNEIESITNEGFTSTTFETSSSSGDIGNSTENVPIPDDAGRHILTVPKSCRTDKNGNCRKTW